MSLTVDQYWEGQLAALRKRSVEVEPLSKQELDGSLGFILPDPVNPSKGIIDARIWFNEGAFLDIFEHVEIRNDIPNRTRYSYHLSVDGQEIERHDYASDLPEPIRYHINRQVGDQPVHVPSERVTLVYLVEQCWALIEEHRAQWA